MTGQTYFEHVDGQPELHVVEYLEPSTPEAAALRVVLTRMRQDLTAMQCALHRTTEERDYWRLRGESLERQLADLQVELRFARGAA